MYDEGPRTALIIGAGSAVARELATLFAQDGHHLILVDRAEPALRENAETLRRRHQIRVTPIGADFADPQAPRAVYDQVCERGIVVAYLVNDAGHDVRGDGGLAEELSLIQANVAAVVTLTQLFLRDMLARDEGRILQLASPLKGAAASTVSAVLGGCRAFIQNFTAAAAEQLRDTHVTMTALLSEPSAETAGQLARAGYRALMFGGAVGLASNAEGIRIMPGGTSRAALPDDGVIAVRMRRPPGSRTRRLRH